MKSDFDRRIPSDRKNGVQTFPMIPGFSIRTLMTDRGTKAAMLSD